MILLFQRAELSIGSLGEDGHNARHAKELQRGDRPKMATKEQIIEDINTLYGDMSFELDEALQSMNEIREVVEIQINALDEDIGRRDMGE